MNKKLENRASRDISRAALAVTEGLFSHSVDMTLWILVYLGELSLPSRSYGKAWRAATAADRYLHQINYEVIKNAIITAKKHGYVRTSTHHAWPQITQEGKRRLSKVIPRYDEKRIWDGRMHMVTYDIPEKKRKDRYAFREYLRRIGCGRLQDSVWITPYNPIDTLRLFVEEHKLQGTIIVSNLGQGGSIGEEDIHAMIIRVYELEDLNDRYKDWLDETRSMRIDQLSLVHFLSILKEDPQLPFTLLPTWWKGDEVYLKVKHLLKSYVNSYPTGYKLT